MSFSILFARALFFFLSFIIMCAYVVSMEEVPTPATYLWGASMGFLAGGLFIGLDLAFKQLKLRTFNIVVVGLFFGYLMFLALNLIFSTLLDISGLNKDLPLIEVTRLFFLLFGSYLGLTTTLRAADTIHFSIPFVKFTSAVPSAKNTPKPLMQKGESLKIKIQRLGKEELQGVGYLDDGTMVVVNGGRTYMGEIISTRVLSIKETPSGRMIFCNVAESEMSVYDDAL